MAFSMILSMMPVASVSVAAVGATGPAVTIHDARADGPAGSNAVNHRGGWIVGNNTVLQQYWRDGVGHNADQLVGHSPFPRALTFSPDFYAIAGGQGGHIGMFNVSGLGSGGRTGYGMVLPDLRVYPQIGVGTASDAQTAANRIIEGAWAAAGRTLPPQVGGVSPASILPPIRSDNSWAEISYDNRLANELIGLHFQSFNGGANYYGVALVRDGDNRSRVRVYISFDLVPGDNPSTAVLPINFVTYGSGDVSLGFMAGGFGHLNRTDNFPLAVSQAYGFELGIDGTIRPFNTRTALRPIDIREIHAGAFRPDEAYQIELTLERGFAFDRRHDGNITNTNAHLRVARDDGGVRLNAARGSQSFGNPIYAGMIGYEGTFPRGTGDAASNPRRVDRTNPYYGIRTQVEEISRDRNRRLITAPFMTSNQASIHPDTLRIGANNSLWIQADGGRTGDVRVYVELFRVTSTGTPSNLTQDDRRHRDDHRELLSSGWVTAARLADDEILFYTCEDADLEDYDLISGMREWDLLNTTWDGALGGLAGLARWDAVDPESPAPYYHQTAWAVLTETVHGALPFTGLRDIDFTFPEGVQVLGMRWETNDAHFAPAAANNNEGEVWFYDGRLRYGPLEVMITRNRVSMRPEIGRVEERYRIAEMRVQFYVSILPGFTQVHGTDEIEVTVTGPGFEDGLSDVIALVRDPITVDIVPVTIDDGGEAAWGRIRHENLNDIVITENFPGALRNNTRLWVGVEGGIALGWGVADQVALSSTVVEVDGDSGLRVSQPVRDQRGTFVNIDRASNNDPGVVTFRNIEISGALVAGNNYDVIVAGSAVADNFGVSGFGWDGPLFGGGTFTQIGHGLFTQEPYPTQAFNFIGTDVFAPPGVGPTPQPPTTTQPQGRGTQRLTAGQSWPLSDGTVRPAPVAVGILNPTTGANDTFVDVRVVADIFGWPWSATPHVAGMSFWDAATSTVTFAAGGDTIQFTTGATNGVINNNPAALRPGNQVTTIDGRMFIPVSFFIYYPQWGSVSWEAATSTVVITPR